jgi:hypothetical protein
MNANELLARISNWLHGRTGESVLELAKAVDAALETPRGLETMTPWPNCVRNPRQNDVVCKLTIHTFKGSVWGVNLVDHFAPEKLRLNRSPIALPDGRSMIGFDFRPIIQEKGGAVLQHEHEHTVLTRGCELCLNTARALTPEERDECMLMLESIETVRCQVGGIYGMPATRARDRPQRCGWRQLGLPAALR